jgi:hypothetical protein
MQNDFYRSVFWFGRSRDLRRSRDSDGSNRERNKDLQTSMHGFSLRPTEIHVVSELLKGEAVRAVTDSATDAGNRVISIR